MIVEDVRGQITQRSFFALIYEGKHALDSGRKSLGNKRENRNTRMSSILVKLTHNEGNWQAPK